MKSNELYALEIELINEVVKEKFSWHKIIKMLTINSIVTRS